MSLCVVIDNGCINDEIIETAAEHIDDTGHIEDMGGMYWEYSNPTHMIKWIDSVADKYTTYTWYH